MERERDWGVEPQPFRCLLIMCFLQIHTNYSELRHFGELDFSQLWIFHLLKKANDFGSCEIKYRFLTTFVNFLVLKRLVSVLRLGLGKLNWQLTFSRGIICAFLPVCRTRFLRIYSMLSQMNVWRSVVVFNHHY